MPEVYESFVKDSAVTVLARVAMERFLTPAWLDDLFDRVAESQYTKELLFSTVFELMSQTVCGTRKSVHAAYRASAADLTVSIVSVYKKLQGLESETSAALVRESGREVAKILDLLGARRPSWIEGYRIKLLDGNCLAASEHRLEVLREVSGGPLPGKSLVVFDPSLEVAVDVFPCEDGHTQERALLGDVIASAQLHDVWIADRNFCTRPFLFGLVERGAHFIIREHAQLPWQAKGRQRKQGQTETGDVYEQCVHVEDERRGVIKLRRITVRLHKSTRDGDTEIHVLTDLPGEVVDAQKVAQLYRKRWTIETVFQHLERNLNSEIRTLGYPKAALFGFCVALLTYNVLAVVHGALRAAHGADRIDEEFSSYYLSEELSVTARGMMIAVPAVHWQVFRHMPVGEFSRECHRLASHVKLIQFKKSHRGPKKPRPKRDKDPKRPHVSTARLLAAQYSK